MSSRNFIIVLLGLMFSLPLWSQEKASHDEQLDHVYQTVIRDSQKKLTPAMSEGNFYLPVLVAQKGGRAPASVIVAPSTSASEARHAAIPWAADASVSKGVFSLK
jgi:hypothetical protein